MVKREFEIWSEGYCVTGMEGRPAGASLMARVEAKSWEEALVIFSNLSDDNKKCTSLERQTYWGCHLFDNEIDARKRFG